MTDSSAERQTNSIVPLDELAAQLTELVRLTFEPEDGQLSIDRLLHYAASIVPGCEQAAVTLTRGTKPPETLAATGELARIAEQLEYDIGEGPCLQAVAQSDVVVADDLITDSHWPVFGPRIAELTGVRSMMAFRLYLTDNHRGALNFYSTERAGFGDDAVAIGAIFAAYTSLALSHRIEENKRTHLERALESNREIGIALGVVAARQLCTPEQAFERLREASQHLNRKLRDVASDVVRTGELPPVRRLSS